MIAGLRQVLCGIVAALLSAALCGAQAATAATPPQAAVAEPQQPQQPYTFQGGTSLVLVPATVDIKGQILYGLKQNQFEVTADGVPQRFRLEQDADALGLSLVVVVQCSRSAMAEYGKIEQLPTVIENLVGAAPHEIAMVRYGAHPELVQPFTKRIEKVNASMARMGPCEDGEAATMDALSYAASILENRESRNRRAILLISETRDHGSKVKEQDVIAQLGRNNIVVDSFAFSPYRDSLANDVKPGRGSGLLGTGVNLLLAAVQALRENVPKAVSRLSGGEYDNFGTKKGFEQGFGRLTNRMHNYYLLSFTVPQDVEPGLHEIKVTVPEYPEAMIRARRDYWAGDVPKVQ